MYEDSGYFDPSHDSTPIPPPLLDSPSHLPDYGSFTNNGLGDSLRIDLDDPTASITLDHIQLHDPNNHGHHLGFDLMQEEINVAPQMEAGAMNWDAAGHQMYPEAAPYGHAPDLLDLLQLPRCAVGPPPMSFDSSRPANIWADEGSMYYDPSVHVGYVGAQPDVLRDLYQSLPQNYGLFCGVEERESTMAGGGVFQEMGDGRQFDAGAMDYRRADMGKGEVKGNFATERQRREQLNEKYKALRSLVPNPTKVDRASIVGDAIEYIKELLRTVDELKILVDKKKHGRERVKMMRTDDEAAADMESSSMRPARDDDCPPPNGALRCSWLQRKSKDGYVDVRIIDNEANIKLNQKKRPNCLVYIAKVLDELQLDLLHLAGCNIGDSYVVMLNTKICEGSPVYAGAIAKKLLEVMDRQYTTLGFPTSY